MHVKTRARFSAGERLLGVYITVHAAMLAHTYELSYHRLNTRTITSYLIYILLF